MGLEIFEGRGCTADGLVFFGGTLGASLTSLLNSISERCRVREEGV